MQKKFVALCFLAGALGSVSLQAAKDNKTSWKEAGYDAYKYLALSSTGINMSFQLTKLFTPKIVTGIAAKVGALSTIKFVGPCGAAVVTKLAPYFLYGYGVPAFLLVGVGGTLAYKVWVLKKPIFPDAGCGPTKTRN